MAHLELKALEILHQAYQFVTLCKISEDAFREWTENIWKNQGRLHFSVPHRNLKWCLLFFTHWCSIMSNNQKQKSRTSKSGSILYSVAKWQTEEMGLNQGDKETSESHRTWVTQY